MLSQTAHYGNHYGSESNQQRFRTNSEKLKLNEKHESNLKAFERAGTSATFHDNLHKIKVCMLNPLSMELVFRAASREMRDVITSFTTSQNKQQAECTVHAQAS